jgi:hypothetical protein
MCWGTIIPSRNGIARHPRCGAAKSSWCADAPPLAGAGDDDPRALDHRHRGDRGGEIRDEYDIEEPQIRQQGSRCDWVSGRVPVEELSERLDTDFGVDDVMTVGGLVYELLGRVPRSGESLVHAGFRLVAERVLRRRMRTRVLRAPRGREDARAGRSRRNGSDRRA